MLTNEEIEELESKLKAMREELFKQRRQFDNSWKNLHESEIEYEERAQMENIAQPLEELDELEKERIEKIDRALQKITSGIYGTCELCGHDISLERLRAIPWTSLCKKCQWKKENPELAAEGAPEGE